MNFIDLYSYYNLLNGNEMDEFDELETGVEDVVFDVTDPWEVWVELKFEELEFDWDPLLIGVDEFDCVFMLPVIFV